ncbi:PAS domain-containing protein [Rhodoblastus acidophilus]|uniref:Blue-light-activated histidine kinase n=1 Tax=Candidatus Rhodoblastus alkanivorans TaxID=2954117 RepID=A0ABS9Z2J8_9HYPH|nr:HWE histidine kinase domain-containing protein [Candidatus Rhodoblastus alkanivorans]MCI4677478.1 PAS domain-containing protein [Candidatus Rhodoblastus alkanivorans]MCI4681837.1 PAS domain-containing protein [Candidatus Rhodoblastus alkanivorans]MDI4642887.1 PAS domain-containing protein [Rhodoblastus acidophilus]
MRFISDIAVGIACLTAALAILFYLSRRRDVAAEDRTALWCAIFGLALFGGLQMAGVAAIAPPGWSTPNMPQFIAAVVALASAFAIWAMAPKWLSRPTVDDLPEKSSILGGAAQESAERLERLAAEKAALENAVAARTRELDEVNQRFFLALKNTGVTMSQQDRDLRYVWIHNAPQGRKRREFVGHLQAEVLPPELEPRIAQAKRQAMEQRSSVRIEVQATVDGEKRWFDERFEPIARDGEITGVMTTSIDTTAYRRQEEDLRELLRELTHRTKNLLAVIQGIARQSGRAAPDVASFVTEFNGRIRALSVTHELLVSANWSGVDLKSLIEAVWRATSPLTLARVSLSGESRKLAPEAAQNLALAVHEMAANAAACGGDAQNAAQDAAWVRISWSPYCEEEGRGVTILWEESAAAPPDQGLGEFAKFYVESLLPRATGGASEIVATKAGARWTLKLPSRNFIS